MVRAQVDGDDEDEVLADMGAWGGDDLDLGLDGIADVPEPAAAAGRGGGVRWLRLSWEV